uniref:Uncharacterized protein n=1 Tax=Glossina austeni TaxID=7395 RepID=A0A1A9V883_GLOAU
MQMRRDKTDVHSMRPQTPVFNNDSIHSQFILFNKHDNNYTVTQALLIKILNMQMSLMLQLCGAVLLTNIVVKNYYLWLVNGFVDGILFVDDYDDDNDYHAEEDNATLVA